MKHAPLLVVALLATLAASAAAQRAAHAFNKCITCHGMPDPAVPGDRLWIDRIKTTACVVPPAPKSDSLRRSLIAYLRGKKPERPTLVDRERPLESGEGTFVANLRRGSLLLYPERSGTPLRITWDGDKHGRARAVPAGRYRVRNYKVIKTDRAGVEWQLWSSTPNGHTVVVRPGERTFLHVDTRVHVTPCGRVTKRGDLRVGLMIQGHGKAGVTVVRAGERVPATYQVFDGERPIRDGRLDYG